MANKSQRPTNSRQVPKTQRQHTCTRRVERQTLVDPKADALVKSETASQELIDTVLSPSLEPEHPQPEEIKPKTEQSISTENEGKHAHPEVPLSGSLLQAESGRGLEPLKQTGAVTEQISQDPGQSEQKLTETEEDTLEFGLFKTRRVQVAGEEDIQDTIAREPKTDGWGPEMLSPEETSLAEQFFEMKLYLGPRCIYNDPRESYQRLREQLQLDWRIWSVLKRNEYHQDFLEWVESCRGAHRWRRILNRANPKTWVDRRKIWNQAKRDCLAEIRREREVYFLPAARELEDRFLEEVVKACTRAQSDHFKIPGFGHMRKHSRMKR